MTHPTRADGARRRSRWPYAVLAAIVVALYARTLGYGLYLDDYTLARHWSGHDLAEAFTGRFDLIDHYEAYFRPFNSLAFGLEWFVWRGHPLGYHVTNLALHIAVVCVLFRFLSTLRLPRAAAFAGAVYFALVPSNAAAVVYVAERTDAVVALLALTALLAVRRYHRSRDTRSLVTINVSFLVALMFKEQAVALLPLVAVYWLYLHFDRDGSDTADVPAPPTSTGLVGHARSEVALLWRTIVHRCARRDWMILLGPMLGVFAGYFVYRQAALPSGSLSDHFAEGKSPPHALVDGVASTFKGVPWELKSFAMVPLAAAFVLALAVAPRAREWRIVVLGVAMIVAGVLPLTFNGATEPRLLYVAELGMAVAVAALTAIFVARLRADGGARQRALRAAVGALGVAVAATTIVQVVRAQDLFEPGSAKKLDGDIRIWSDPRNHPYIVPEQLEQLERRLVENGQIPAP